MGTLTSRPTEPTARPSRNHLFIQEQETVNRYRERVVRELLQWISQSDKNLIRVSPKGQVISFHHGLGTAIRNEYELWMPEHEVTAIWHQCEREFPLEKEQPNVPAEITVDGETIKIGSSSLHIDDHPCHPDNFSAACIQELWEKLQ